MPIEAKNKMVKGFPCDKSMTCILCPNSCVLRFSDDGKVFGNKCDKGKLFAKQELASPVRSLTTTMRDEGGQLIPVKSEFPIPKDMIIPAIETLSKIVLKRKNYSLNEIVFRNVLGLEINIITTTEVFNEEAEIDYCANTF